LQPSNAAAYPSSFRVHDNVRWLATVNVDDTVERLSPRFLSRTSVLWVEPDVDAMLSGTRLGLPDETPVRWADVWKLAHERDLGELGPVGEVVRYLHEHKVPGAPTPRGILGMRRYLAAADGVLDVDVARDHQVLQRIIPGLRGVGRRYREVFERLADILQARGWLRSAAKVAALRMRGEAAGDFYDAFHG
jgi:hypothetical protein